jgi:RNA polymerase sigma factor (sigma-70 family)
MRVARQASLCHDDALDAYQRALEIFVRRVESVDPETEVAWLKVVIRHEAMAIRRARTESVSGGDLDLDAFVPAPDRTVEDQIASGERVRRSAEALRALKADEAKALMMKAHGLSYEEIGERNGWSYTKVNRAITEGRRRFIKAYEGIESGEECERFTPIVQALSTGSATAAQVLEIRPHLRHCTACRATVRDLHVSRARRASLFWPIFIVAEPFSRVGSLRHELAALFHRAQASDVATGAGLAGSGGGGRIATLATALGVCLSGATVGTVCVVTGTVPDFGRDQVASVKRSDEKPRRERPKREQKPTSSAPPVVAAQLRPTPRATATPTAPRARARPNASSARSRRTPAKEAAPREFSFENQASAAPASASTARSTAPPPPPPSPPTTTSKKFSPAEQEFAP